MLIWGQGVYGKTVLYAQFCEPKVALKNKVFFCFVLFF